MNKNVKIKYDKNYDIKFINDNAVSIFINANIESDELSIYYNLNSSLIDLINNSVITLTDDTFNIDILKHLNSLGLYNGVFNIKYKVYIQLDNLTIADIATSRTEIKCLYNNLLDLDLSSTFINVNDEDLLLINYKYLNNFLYLKTIDPVSQTSVSGDSIILINKLFNDFIDVIELVTYEEPSYIKNELKLSSPEIIINNSKYYNYNELSSYDNTTANEFLLGSANNTSFYGIDLNIDYTSFSNFIKFSTITYRLEIFKNKLKAYEYYNDALNNLTSSSVYKDNIVTELINIKSSFDGYEKYLFYNSGSMSWPKTNTTKPYTLYSVYDNESIEWFQTMYDLALDYDRENVNNILNVIPSLIRMDSNNNEFIKFINMAGVYLDNLNLYIKNITNIRQTSYDMKTGAPKDLIIDMLNNYNFKIDSVYALKTMAEYFYENQQ